jgi:hypothetical protein
MVRWSRKTKQWKFFSNILSLIDRKIGRCFYP